MKAPMQAVLFAAAVSAAGVGAPVDTPDRAGRERLAPVNPCRGTRERVEVFAFAEKPAVQREGGKYVITFATTAACDATVAIVAPDGRIVRHLAGGVLGENAPYPFRQGTLRQRLVWDGTDDAGRPVAAQGFSVRVGLGLTCRFERDLGYDPYEIPTGTGGSQLPEVRRRRGRCLVGRGPDGNLYVLAMPARAGWQGRVFDRQGRYLRTFWPPSADEVQRLARFGWKFASTTRGEKVLVADWFGPKGFLGDPRKEQAEALGKAPFEMAGVKEYAFVPRPETLPPRRVDPLFGKFFDGKMQRMAVDRARDELYIGHPGMGLARIDARTGLVDRSWFPEGDLDRVTEVAVGPDGLVYISTGGCGYGQFITRLDRAGRPVDFAGDSVPLPKGNRWTGGRGQYGPMEGKPIFCGRVSPLALRKLQKEIRSLWTGHFGHSNTHERGLYVSPRGFILAAVQYPDARWAIEHGVPPDAPRKKRNAGSYRGEVVLTSYVSVWDRTGKLLTANAVGDMQNGHGVAMDARGNLYAAMGGRVPAGQTTYLGIRDVKPAMRVWGGYGSLLKFRGGVPFPRGKACYGKDLPRGAVRLVGHRRGVTGIEGALWIYGGLVCQSPDVCTCNNLRYDMDYFARHWLPANHLYSIVVLDANGNRMARIGRYGNVDDTARDVAAGRDGVRLVWPRAVAVSDTALYVADTGNRRILKARIAYRAEEEVALP